jgi:spore coat polysaccharide biosynthesis protein SpsF
MTTLAIIQARMSSTRLPGKVLHQFAGRSALAHCVERTRACPAIDEVIVATTTDPRDEVLIDACEAAGWRWARGAEDDVLDRYYQAAQPLTPDVVVRITSDCPLTDPAVIGALLAHRAAAGADYASTSYPAATFPIGISVEAMTFDALATAWREDRDPAWREHVTPYLYRHPARFKLAGLAADGAFADHRWTLDTPEDAELLRRIFDELTAHPPAQPYAWREVLAIVAAHPGWERLNAAIVQKVVPPGRA